MVPVTWPFPKYDAQGRIIPPPQPSPQQRYAAALERAGKALL